tara:strand:- start:863 stop:1054 length:192 start_codon:yes stop_codon:yes gene_type:complete
MKITKKQIRKIIRESIVQHKRLSPDSENMLEEILSILRFSPADLQPDHPLVVQIRDIIAKYEN